MSADLRELAQARGCTPDQFLRGFACRRATNLATAPGAPSRSPEPVASKPQLRVDAQRPGVAVSIDIGTWAPGR